MKRRLPLVIVTWVDASTQSGWTDLHEIKANPVKVKTVGWLLSETDQCVTLFSSFTQDQAAGEVTTIPAPWVTSIKRLRGNPLAVEGEAA